MEVSSHALAQDRTRGLEWKVAVFTNLTQDHLDFHGTMENYFEAKAKLFTRLASQKQKDRPVAIVNIDDRYGNDVVRGSARSRGRDYDFSCSVNPYNGNVRNLDLRRR